MPAQLGGASRALLALLILAGGLTAFYGAEPPRAKGLDAAPTEFSGSRAMAHSHKFAIEPRPRGGHAAARGRDYIVRALEEIGVEVELHRTPINHGTSVTFVENVLGRIAGTDSTQTFGMTAHYDSVAWGPGAADDGSGVVVMIEAARALKCGPPLKHDVVFVFTGDEEGGGNGSVNSLSHPWLKDLNVMLGLEGRGDWGTAYMFETSEGNLPLMLELAKSGAPAVSNSMMYQVHRRTPNTTDFTHMARNGALGYNVAFVGGLGYYHTANDKPEHLSPDTIQHMGEYVMALVRHYDAGGPKIAKGEEAVFFNTIGKHLVVYPLEMGRWVAIVAGVLFAAALFVVLYLRAARLLAILEGTLLVLLALALTAAIGGALQWSSYKLFYVYIMYNAFYYNVSFALLGLGLLLGLLHFSRARMSAASLHVVYLIAQLAALIPLELYQPYASYSAAWPLIIGSLGLMLCVLLRRVGLPEPLVLATHLLSVFPFLLFLLPGLKALYHMGGAITPVPWAGLVVLLLLALSPVVLSIVGGQGKRISLALIAASVALFLAGWATQRYTPEKPKMNSLTYAVNLDSNEAIWITTDRDPDAWVSQFIPADQAKRGGFETILPGGRDDYLHAPAPIAPLARSEVSVVSDAVADGKRELVLKYTWRRSIEQARFEVQAPAKVLKASVDGPGEVLADMSGWSLRVGYLPYDGEMTLRLTLEEAVDTPVRLQVFEETFSLPELTTLGYRPRPDWMIPKPNTLDWWEENHLESHHTKVTQTFSF
ncbi:MAG: hypothetical protein RLZZ303_17 [Candidatus Hydrogenedentota bacterium]